MLNNQHIHPISGSYTEKVDLVIEFLHELSEV